MTLTIQGFNVSGYTTGTTGLENNKVLYFYVTGLKNDTETLDFYKRLFVTGYGYISGNEMSNEYSGLLYWEQDNDRWEGSIVITDSLDAGNSGACSSKWEFNSGAINESLTGFSTGVMLFKNASEDRWDTITNANGSVDNADGQHSHASAPSSLGDLNDVFIPGTITDNDALVYFAASGGWTTGQGGGGGASQLSDLSDVRDVSYGSSEYLRSDGVDEYYSSTIQKSDVPDYEAVSGEVNEITGTVYDYKAVSGDFAGVSGSYATLSGVFATLSGHFSEVSGDFSQLSGVFATLSGHFSEVSGAHSEVSGDFSSHIEDSTAHHDPSGYETVSGDHIDKINQDVKNTADPTFNSLSLTVGIDAGGNIEGGGDIIAAGAVTGLSGIFDHALIGNVNGSDYLKIYFDGSNVRIDVLGGNNVLLSGNLSGILGSKVYGAVLL